MKKTNAIRLLEQAGVAYEARTYPVNESDLSGTHAAAVLGIPAEQVFKTLVLRGAKTGYFVCCIPVDQEVDLKKAAKAAGDKKAEMLPMKELLPVTGYIRGGCSPVGMKKKFPTFLDTSAQNWDRISVSAGTRGEMVLVEPERLRELTAASYAALTL
jgi:Cys-tRNA(Pro)/Cys-tRNA(Cys) deacylase